jgi:hypothetical protein
VSRFAALPYLLNIDTSLFGNEVSVELDCQAPEIQPSRCSEEQKGDGMDRVRCQFAFGLFLVLAVVVLPASVQAQALPSPAAFVRYLDVRCYKIPDQPPLGVNLRLDHLNPVFLQYGAPPEFVTLQEPQELCVPVQKEDLVPPPGVLPFIQYVDWKCYGISGPPLNLPIHLDQLNPVIQGLYGPTDVIVREPQQLCVPVAKNDQVPPPAVLSLIQWLDVKCYRVDAPPILPQPIRLTHLNPLLAGTATEDTRIEGPAPIQLCVPVAKNQRFPPTAVAPIVRFSDVLCYNLLGQPLDRALKLSHLNPVLRNMGLPPEFVKVTDSTKLCVPVAKNGQFPPTAVPVPTATQ